MIILSPFRAALINAQANHMEKNCQEEEKYVDRVIKILDNMSMIKVMHVFVKMDSLSIKEDA